MVGINNTNIVRKKVWPQPRQTIKNWVVFNKIKKYKIWHCVLLLYSRNHTKWYFHANGRNTFTQWPVNYTNGALAREKKQKMKGRVAKQTTGKDMQETEGRVGKMASILLLARQLLTFGHLKTMTDRQQESTARSMWVCVCVLVVVSAVYNSAQSFSYNNWQKIALASVWVVF